MAINNAGAIVGSYNINLTGPHGFLYQNGVYTNIDYPGAGVTSPTAINNSGVVGGITADATGSHGFLYGGGKFEAIHDPASQTDTGMTGVNDKGVIVGIIGIRARTQTFKGVPTRQD